MANDIEEAVQLLYFSKDIMSKQQYTTFVMNVCYELVKNYD